MTGAIPLAFPAIDGFSMIPLYDNLAVFKRIVFAAVLAGLIAGLLLTAVQRLQVVPIILEAERIELARGVAAPRTDLAAAGGSRAAVSDGHDVSHRHESTDSSRQSPKQSASHQHTSSGVQRTMLTALVNISLAVGFGLLLGAVFSLRKIAPSWRSGLLWGLAGYAVFFAAPSLGMPPELPGIESPPLAGRQSWWMLTVLLSAIGLALIFLVRPPVPKVVGAIALVLPHLFGTMTPAVEGNLAQLALAYQFVVATALANAVFWLVLGGLSGFFYRRIA